MAQKKITELQLRSEVEDDLSIPSDDGIQSYRITGSQVYTYIRSKLPPNVSELTNLSIATSVSSNALTIALKTYAGTNPAADDKIRVAFRSSTVTSAAYLLREISAATSLTISSGSTLGTTSAQGSRIYVYLIDNAGAVELAVSRTRFSEDDLVSTTAEGGAGAADSSSVMYSATARSSVAFRLIGYISSTQTTAGTWASAGSKVQLSPFDQNMLPTLTRLTTAGTGTYYTPSGCIRLVVRAAGGGSGGGGSGTGGTGGAGGIGGDTYFRVGASPDLIVARGGAAMGNGYTPGLGGTITVNTPPMNVISFQGGTGTCAGQAPSSGNAYIGGGSGGVNQLGGAGGGWITGAGASPVANTGAGGTGGGTNGINSNIAGAGGGAGGYCHAIINNPESAYNYQVGAGGSAGTAGTSGFAGTTGATGVIIVEEWYY
jgi:hypothetical protein